MLDKILDFVADMLGLLDKAIIVKDYAVRFNQLVTVNCLRGGHF